MHHPQASHAFVHIAHHGQLCDLGRRYGMATSTHEARGGQFNYMPVSNDRITWSVPVKAFSDVTASFNPVPCNASCMQWQPNLVLLDGGQRLGCSWSPGWSQGSELDGCYADRTYWSVMDTPPAAGGKWTNRVLTFENGDYHTLIDGRRWQVFPTQNPTHLRSGRSVTLLITT